MNIIELPEDILHIIIEYLSPADLLAFCSISRTLRDNSSILYSSPYWSRATRETFRVPNHPVVEHDGRRWMQLYRRMRTQTKIYSWGNNDGGCLFGAQSRTVPVGPIRGPFRGNNRMRFHRAPMWKHWPEEMRMGDVGVVADLQCGGWSITALNSKGQLYTRGDISRSAGLTDPNPLSKALQYPSDFVSPVERYDAITAIRQFSSGRDHILGLSDSGRIWSWASPGLNGVHIKFLEHDLVESQTAELSQKEGYVRKVVAGWNKSSAYIAGKGIVCWTPSSTAEIEGDADGSMGDGLLVLQSWTVPGTSHARPVRPGQATKGDPKHAEMGEVTSWVVLEQLVLFATHMGGLYASLIPKAHEGADPSLSDMAFRLNDTLDLSLAENDGEKVIDIQGSFRSFAVFNRSGAVLLGSQDAVHEMIRRQQAIHRGDTLDAASNATKFRKIPALQNSGVIAFAFGDWHSHALHSDGTISSYGCEQQSCGALGLAQMPIRYCRGMASGHNRLGDDLITEAYSTGRRVWFEPEKAIWLDWLGRYDGRKVLLDQESRERRDMMESRAVKAEVSEWFEERLRRWETDAPTPRDVEEDPTDPEDDGLPAYFALSVAAAGWHSGALVLVNERKAEKVRDRYRARKSIPEDAPSIWTRAKSLFAGKGEDFRRLNFADGNLVEETVSLNATEDLEDWAKSGASWIWEQEGETFPRLELKNGDVMPGEVEVERLPDHLRDWKEVELVSL